MSEELKDTNINNDGENTFTQEDVNNIVAKNVKEVKEKTSKERAEFLESLGFKDNDELKTTLEEFRQHKESQKTELEKLKEKNAEKDAELQELSTKFKDINNQERLKKAMETMEIDSAYSKAVYKLMDKEKITDDEKEFSKLIEETIEAYLPDAKPIKQVGVEKKEKQPSSSTKNYLNEKYKGNPFYKG